MRLSALVAVGFVALAVCSPAAAPPEYRNPIIFADIGLTRGARGWMVQSTVCPKADTGTPERIERDALVPSGSVYLRVSVQPGAVARFSWSADGSRYQALGEPFVAREGRWVGARVGLFAEGPRGAVSRGWADVDWFRIESPATGPATSPAAIAPVTRSREVAPAGQAARLPAVASSAASIAWNRILDQPDAWYATAEATVVADNVLLYQRATGGWPKNTDMARPLEAAERAQIAAGKADQDSTIDNGATTTQLRLLARVSTATNQPRFRDAFLAGIDYLLKAQYANGGWPQFFPLRPDYSRRITFNDDAMVNVLELLRATSGGQAPYAFVDQARRTKAADAVARGIQVILASQVRVKGRLTAWCAQVDEVTLEPRRARAYEHPSLSGKESVGIVRFLMSIQKPSAEIATAVDAAVAWFTMVRLTGIRVVERADASLPGGFDRVVISDPAAPAIWARFYEIGTNRPIFSGRDSVVRYSLAEIEHERRVNYSWLGPYATDLLARRGR